MATRLSIILFIIWVFIIQDSLPYAQQSRLQQTPRTQISTNNGPDYGLQTVYTASAYVPIDHTGPPLKIVPETENTQYYFVTSTKNETTIPSSSSSVQSPSSTYTRRSSHPNTINEVLKNQTYQQLYPHSHHHRERYNHYYPQQQAPTHLQYLQSQVKSNYPFNLQSQSSNSHHQHPHSHLHHHHHHNHHNNLRQRRLRHHRINGADDCIKCPPEKILIAQKGLDGVLIEQPKLFSCNNRAILNTAYYVETLFGASFQFLLPHGSHSFHGRIKNKKSGKVVQTCLLRYKVIVQQCGRFYPQDNNIKVKCDPGYIWGSKCTFTCRHGFLSADNSMVCGDSLHWEGEEPECLPEPPVAASQSCDFLDIPDNGRFSCEYPNNINSDDFENELVTPDGTLCRVKCNRNYEIPSGWETYSVLKCQNGKWNTTLPNLCQPKKRYNY